MLRPVRSRVGLLFVTTRYRRRADSHGHQSRHTGTAAVVGTTFYTLHRVVRGHHCRERACWRERRELFPATLEHRSVRPAAAQHRGADSAPHVRSPRAASSRAEPYATPRERVAAAVGGRRAGPQRRLAPVAAAIARDEPRHRRRVLQRRRRPSTRRRRRRACQRPAVGVSSVPGTYSSRDRLRCRRARRGRPSTGRARPSPAASRRARAPRARAPRPARRREVDRVELARSRPRPRVGGTCGTMRSPSTVIVRSASSSRNT